MQARSRSGPSCIATRYDRGGTWHIHWVVLIALSDPDAQLPIAVHAPALDSATRLDRASVQPPYGQGDGGHACFHFF